MSNVSVDRAFDLGAGGGHAIRRGSGALESALSDQPCSPTASSPLGDWQDTSTLQAIDDETKDAVADCIEFAEQSPFAAPDAGVAHVYVDNGTR